MNKFKRSTTFKPKKSGFVVKPRRRDTKQNSDNVSFITKPFCNKMHFQLPHNVKTQIMSNIKRFNFKKRYYNSLNNNIQNITPNHLMQIDIKNGMIFQLFLISINGCNYSIFIYEHNNQLMLYNVKFRFEQSLYRGTFINGKIGKNKKNCWIFQMDDLYYYKGSYVQNYLLSEKLQILYKIIRDEMEYDEYINCCILQLANFVPLNHLNFINKECRVLFLSNDNNNNYYTDIKINNGKKETPLNDKEETFVVRKTPTPDVYTLHKNNNYSGIVCVNSQEMSKKLKEIFQNIDEKEMKCKYSEYFNGWFAMC